MAKLTISLLGPLQIDRDGHPVETPVYAKVLALLAYLAMESDRPHQRSTLATLLWPDQSEERARHSLRQALSTLRRVLDRDAPGSVLVSRATVAFNRAAGTVVDALELTELLDACDRHDHTDTATCASCASRIERAVSLYRGDLIEGFSIPDSDIFEDWVQLQRQRLRHRMGSALDSLAAWHERLGRTDDAIAARRRMLELDPLQEATHRHLMNLLWQDGQRAAALAQYERCRELLDAELGVEPEPETVALEARIRDGGERAITGVERQDGAPGSLPSPATRLVGRERELEEIADLLDQRGSRLVTLVGPGGIGKSRLALQVAHDRSSRKDQVVGFVSLADVRDADGACLAIAERLGLSMPASASPARQLAEWLNGRSTFLVLDNAEHLVAELGLLADLLATAPGLRLLVTSRERLKLAAEWIYETPGMGVPAGEETDAFEGYDAVELLTERIRQVRPGVPLRHDERADVIRICRLASGFPLALELAAAWAATLPLSRIATELQQNLDFLASTTHDPADRHASMRAAFSSSWDMLEPETQAAWRRLSVFTGDFDLAAASEIAGASVPIVVALVNASILTRTRSDHYALHELVRQYGDDWLRRDPDEYGEIHDTHARWYLSQLAATEDALTGRDQQVALARIEAMIGNIRSAWGWAVGRGMVDELLAAAHAFWRYQVMRGRMREGAATFGQMLDSLGGDSCRGASCRRALAIAGVYTGGFRSGLGRYDEAVAMLREGIAALRVTHAGRELGLALNMLAAALRMQGRYDEARECLLASLAESERAGDRWAIAFALNDLGMLLHPQSDDEAWRHCEQSRALFRQLGDARGQAFAAHNLGVIAMERGAHRRAMLLHREAMNLRSDSNDTWGLATSLVQLGKVSHALGADDAARRDLARALRIAWEGSITPVTLEALVELTALDADDLDDGTIESVLAALAAHPALPGYLRPRLAALMAPAGIEPDWPGPDAEANRWATQAVDELARRAMARVPAA